MADTDFPRPVWLDEAFIAKVYEDQQPKPSAVDILKCTSVVGVGDNYLSKMIRINVKLSFADETIASREDSLVIKSLENTDKVMKEYGIFQIESDMFAHVLKTFEGYWTEHGRPVEFGAK